MHPLDHSTKAPFINDYQLILSRRKTIGLTVERDSRLVVRAPEGTTTEQVRAVLAQKALWLYRQHRHAQCYPADPIRKEFVSGEWKVRQHGASKSYSSKRRTWRKVHLAMDEGAPRFSAFRDGWDKVLVPAARCRNAPPGRNERFSSLSHPRHLQICHNVIGRYSGILLPFIRRRRFQ